MEFTISESHTYPGAGPNFGRELEMDFFPTEYTFEFLDRWKEAHKEDPEIPYPEELIHSQNWF
ncbi:MAG TPA: hypothetical protein VK072_01065 [Candidatus Avamphibacillus sp.]|nr:hypothetical protein [Candidatus Avamphibacillus sp.]